MDGPTPVRLDVPGASRYCEVAGSGPSLVLIPTGNDCGPFRPLALRSRRSPGA